ncbi:MAG TPA: SRPBCC family protein [Verrucomicrobiae bacterium]|jgi:uncharacterized protein YndB with AHSA1/START domain
MTTHLTAEKSKQEIVITRVFDAPRALVFKAWTDPKHLAQWWGPRGFTNPRCELDVRPGGLIRIDMQAPNGTIYPMTGVYLEIIEPERLTYTSGALDEKGHQLFEFLHAVTFAERNGKTTLTITSRIVKTTAEAAKYIGGFEAGMTQSLEKLAGTFTQKNAPLTIERTYNAPIALVWRALTHREDMAKWYFNVPEFKAEAGFEFQFTVPYNGKDCVHLCRVTEVQAAKKIAYTWRYAGHPGDSLVTFELFDEAGKTRLKLTHEGLESFPPGTDFAPENFARGWTSLLGESLKKFIETK